MDDETLENLLNKLDGSNVLLVLIFLNPMETLWQIPE
jgi:hypothetical protein